MFGAKLKFVRSWLGTLWRGEMVLHSLHTDFDSLKFAS